MSLTIIGGSLILSTLILAYILNYYMNIRRTSSGGVIMVDSFGDYVLHGTLNLLIGIALLAMFLAGLILIIAGWMAPDDFSLIELLKIYMADGLPGAETYFFR